MAEPKGFAEVGPLMIKIAANVNFALVRGCLSNFNIAPITRTLKPCHEAVTPPVQSRRNAPIEWKMKTSQTLPTNASPAYKRWLPLALLLGASVACYALGLQHYLSLQRLAENQTQLLGFVTQNLVLAMAIYFLIYVLVVALSLPGAALLSVAGGFIFGWVISAPLTIIAATIGAAVVFKIVQTSLGANISQKAGPFVKKLSGGFENDAFNYLLFLRLVPAFPFFAVNAVAGLTRMPMRTFFWATLIGIIPGSYAFAWLGRGLGSVIDAQTAAHAACVAEKSAEACPYNFAVSSLVTPQLLWALAAMGLVSLLPVLIKKWKTQK